MNTWGLLPRTIATLGLALSTPFVQSAGGVAAEGIYGVGVQMGFVEMGSFLGVEPGTLAQGLYYAHGLAQASGCIPTDEIDGIRAAMLATRDSRSLYQRISAYRQTLASYIAAHCSCGADSSNAGGGWSGLQRGDAALTPGWDNFSVPIESGRVYWSVTPVNGRGRFVVTFEIRGSAPNRSFGASVHFFQPDGMPVPAIPRFGNAYAQPAGGSDSREGRTGNYTGVFEFGALATDSRGNGSATFTYDIDFLPYYAQFTVRVGPNCHANADCPAVFRTGQRFAQNFEHFGP